MKILLVEDNEGDILLTQEALFENDSEIDLKIVRDGQSALDYVFKRNRYAEAESPDLILLDINIPRMNGHEVLKAIKTSEYRAIPVVILTTSTAENDIVQAYTNGVNAYVVKDFIFEDLNHVVTQIQYFWNSVATLPVKKYA
ncbi:response regulator [Zeaxanthinibacter enoshimensis]|nr:response regulator [Zeaxanthinibacter enoshimensis]